MQEGNTYNLKKIIIFGVIILIIAGLIGFYFINKKNNTTNPDGSSKDLFPFGDGTPQSETVINIGGNVDETGVPQIDPGTPISTTDGQRLRQITEYPVTNFKPFSIPRRILEPKYDEATGQTNLVPNIVSIDMLRWNIKQTGILMDAEMGQDAIITTQKTSTKIPNAEELWIGKGGNNFVYRTWNADNRSIDSISGSIPTPEPLTYCTIPFTQLLKVGSKNSDVTELQKYINKKLSLNIVVDGSLGPKTFALIKNLQTALAIEPTGTYDKATMDAINADCTEITKAFEREQNGVKALTTTALSRNIPRGTLSPDGTQMFYFIQGNDGVGVMGIIANIDGTGQRKIFESPASEWSAQWVNQNAIALTTLASREADGYMYFLSPTTGDFKKVLGPLRGLTTLVSPDAKKILYSNSSNNGFATRLYNTDTGTVRTLDLSTLPAKCTWQDSAIIICGVPRNITPGAYPDSWYQGVTTFEDTIWLINTVQNNTNIVLAPDQSFDIIKPAVSENNVYLYFINKNDQTLWSYRMK